MEFNHFFKDKKILIIGGTGTVGKKIIEILLPYEPKVIRIFSRDEYKQFIMAEHLSAYRNIRFLIGDVRDKDRVDRASQDIDIIFHLAAMKHVPACEYNPSEAVGTNVIGTQNVIDAAIKNNISHVVLTSSDKAISPTNAMGATKLLGEKLITAADGIKGTAHTRFTAVRFGNVMGSRGSVIPLFKQQIMHSRKITITHPDMTRFMMSITDAAALTMQAAYLAMGGEIFVLKMPVVRLGDLAEVVLEETCKKIGCAVQNVVIENMGLRSGEKMFEELMTEEESAFAYNLPQMYAVFPAVRYQHYALHYQQYPKADIHKYSSKYEQIISKDAIRELIIKEKLL